MGTQPPTDTRPAGGRAAALYRGCPTPKASAHPAPVPFLINTENRAFTLTRTVPGLASAGLAGPSGPGPSWRAGRAPDQAQVHGSGPAVASEQSPSWRGLQGSAPSTKLGPAGQRPSLPCEWAASGRHLSATRLPGRSPAMLWMTSVLLAPRPPPHPGHHPLGGVCLAYQTPDTLRRRHTAGARPVPRGVQSQEGLSFLLGGELTEGPEAPELRF